MAVPGSTIHRVLCFWEFFFAGKGGGHFIFRFNLGPSPESFRGCGSAKVHVCLVFPYCLGPCRGVCVKRLKDSVRRGERPHNNLAITGASAPDG